MKESKKKDINGNSSRKNYQLILLNDDENTFDDVIESLMHICGHNLYQAEQCALIVNNNGEVVIYNGNKKTTEQMYRLLIDDGLFVKIQKKPE